MEEKQYNIRFLTVLLTLTGGYCDSLTFVAANKIFSAHVTGNFIVFAYQLIVGADSAAWGRMLAFPVFLVSVMAGGWLIAKFSSPHFLFFCEGMALLIGGAIVYFGGITKYSGMTSIKYLATMIVVFAMGLQNAVGRCFKEETYGPTTMMTGNVTQFALDVRSYLSSGFTSTASLTKIIRELTTLGCFLTGCILGAYVGHQFGLVGMVLPGIIMVLVFFCRKNIYEWHSL